MHFVRTFNSHTVIFLLCCASLHSVIGPDSNGLDHTGKPYKFLQTNDQIVRWNRRITRLIRAEFPDVRQLKLLPTTS